MVHSSACPFVFYSILFYSILLYSILFCSTLFYSTLLYSVLFYFSFYNYITILIMLESVQFVNLINNFFSICCHIQNNYCLCLLQ